MAYAPLIHFLPPIGAVSPDLSGRRGTTGGLLDLEPGLDDGAGEGVARQGEHEKRRCRRGTDAELLDVHRVHRNEIPVPAVAGGRSRTKEAVKACIVRELNCASGQPTADVVARSGGKRGRGEGDVGDRPVPESARRGGVGIVHAHHEAPGALRKPTPGQLGGGVTAAGAEDAAHLGGGQFLPIGDVTAGEAERRNRRDHVVRIGGRCHGPSLPPRDVRAVRNTAGARLPVGLRRRRTPPGSVSGRA